MGTKLTKEQRRAKLKAKSKKLGGADPTQSKSSTYLKLTNGVKKWEVKEKGMKIIDLVTFDADHDNGHYGLDKDGNGYVAGDEVYARYYGRHKIGNDWYVCRKSIDEDCPVCDRRAKLSRDYEENKDQIKTLYPQIRALYNIIEDREIFVWETTANNKNSFEKKYRSDIEDDDSVIDVQFLDKGKSIQLKFMEDSFADASGKIHKFIALESIKGYPDRDDIGEGVRKKVADLNQALDIKSYEELEKILMTAGIDTEEEEDYDEEETVEETTVETEVEVEEIVEEEEPEDETATEESGWDGEESSDDDW